jgi:8-oxo-dGTP diphosphatase
MNDTDRDQPLIAIDVVPLSVTAAGGLLVGTSVRRFEPFAGERALPGVLLLATETLVEAAHRALATKAGIRPTQLLHLAQLGAFDSRGRDPRSHAVSIAFVGVVEADAGEQTAWNEHPTGLPFDHDAIVATAREHLAARLWSDQPLTRALTGEVFATTRAAAIEAAVRGAKPHAGNFNRSLAGMAALEKREPQAHGPGRPATTWAWRG